MTTEMRECHSCAGTEADGAVLPRGATLCEDCSAERLRKECIARMNAGVPLKKHKIQTRRSYRAQLRARAAKAQRDLVDLVVPSP